MKQSFINDESTELVGHEASILAVPIANNDTYTLHLCNSDNIIQCSADKILKRPSSDKIIPVPNAPQWIKHKAKCTLFLKNRMTTSRQGFLIHKDKWYCKSGQQLRTNHPLIHLMTLKKMLTI